MSLSELPPRTAAERLWAMAEAVGAARTVQTLDELPDFAVPVPAWMVRPSSALAWSIQDCLCLTPLPARIAAHPSIRSREYGLIRRSLYPSLR
jgi:hypothetical protein